MLVDFHLEELHFKMSPRPSDSSLESSAHIGISLRRRN